MESLCVEFLHQGRSDAVDAAGGHEVVQIAGVANYNGPVN
jgi:hypothetical protein